MKIISIGDLVTDFYYKNNKLIGVNGGMTSHNIIANIAKQGFETSVYGVCGNDAPGLVAIKSLKDVGVETNNVNIISDISTRTFHVSYEEKDGKLEFISKKRCPKCNLKKWYEESMIDSKKILENLSDEDVLVFDNLNNKNQDIIDNCKNKKMLDLGQYFELEKYSNGEIVNKIKNKFDLINLNERVEKYLINRFMITSLNELFDIFIPKMIIVTRGKKGSDFVYDQNEISKKLSSPAVEIDPTGAGDAFFSVIISEYVKNNFYINNDFIDLAFEKATKLTKKVVEKFGARGHIQSLYKIKQIKDVCTCTNFELTIRKQIKRCNININNLEVRIMNAIKCKDYNKLSNIDLKKTNNIIFIGTGGSFAGAKFSSKVINNLYGINTSAMLPRDFYYRNNLKTDLVFLFTYSGTTNDLLISTSAIDNSKKYILTKGEIQKIVTKTNISKSNIISYRTGTNKGKERGFLSFEGAVAPASLFLKLYFENTSKNSVEDFIRNSINYWKSYYDKYFKEHKDMLKDFFKKGNSFNIFSGDFTESASCDLESKIIESGIFNCLIHEKKNFSHGRFINYEHLSSHKNIYFKQKSESEYEKKLLEYLSNDNNIIIESKFDGILCEYDLLIASQFLIYYISNFLNIDISKPTYSDCAMNIYFYKGKI